MTDGIDQTKSEMEQDEHALIAQRRAKLAALREQGIAFPTDFRRNVMAGELHAEYGNKDNPYFEANPRQRQRVAVVRALINKPGLLLADEPTGSLDRAASEKIADLLVELNKSERVTLIVVTHSFEFAKRIGPVSELNDGLLQERSRQ